jgi:hypothetical protein
MLGNKEFKFKEIPEYYQPLKVQNDINYYKNNYPNEEVNFNNRPNDYSNHSHNIYNFEYPQSIGGSNNKDNSNTNSIIVNKKFYKSTSDSNLHSHVRDMRDYASCYNQNNNNDNSKSPNPYQHQINNTTNYKYMMTQYSDKHYFSLSQENNGYFYNNKNINNDNNFSYYSSQTQNNVILHSPVISSPINNYVGDLNEKNKFDMALINIKMERENNKSNSSSKSGNSINNNITKTTSVDTTPNVAAPPLTTKNISSESGISKESFNAFYKRMNRDFPNSYEIKNILNNDSQHAIENNSNNNNTTVSDNNSNIKKDVKSEKINDILTININNMKISTMEKVEEEKSAPQNNVDVNKKSNNNDEKMKKDKNIEKINVEHIPNQSFSSVIDFESITDLSLKNFGSPTPLSPQSPQSPLSPSSDEIFNSDSNVLRCLNAVGYKFPTSLAGYNHSFSYGSNASRISKIVNDFNNNNNNNSTSKNNGSNNNNNKTNINNDNNNISDANNLSNSLNEKIVKDIKNENAGIEVSKEIQEIQENDKPCNSNETKIENISSNNEKTNYENISSNNEKTNYENMDNDKIDNNNNNNNNSNNNNNNNNNDNNNKIINVENSQSSLNCDSNGLVIKNNGEKDKNQKIDNSISNKENLNINTEENTENLKDSPSSELPIIDTDDINSGDDDPRNTSVLELFLDSDSDASSDDKNQNTQNKNIILETNNIKSQNENGKEDKNQEVGKKEIEEKNRELQKQQDKENDSNKINSDNNSKDNNTNASINVNNKNEYQENGDNENKNAAIDVSNRPLKTFSEINGDTLKNSEYNTDDCDKVSDTATPESAQVQEKTSTKENSNLNQLDDDDIDEDDPTPNPIPVPSPNPFSALYKHKHLSNSVPLPEMNIESGLASNYYSHDHINEGEPHYEHENNLVDMNYDVSFISNLDNSFSKDNSYLIIEGANNNDMNKLNMKNPKMNDSYTHSLNKNPNMRNGHSKHNSGNSQIFVLSPLNGPQRLSVISNSSRESIHNDIYSHNITNSNQYIFKSNRNASPRIKATKYAQGYQKVYTNLEKVHFMKESFKYNQEEIDFRSKLTIELSEGNHQCIICYKNIHPKDSIWSCPYCYEVLHIGCVHQWYSENKSINGSWECPFCKYTLGDEPSEYYCYCHKMTNPKFNEYIVPHSCGNMCGRRRSDCSHPCKEKCHPGPCDPCLEIVGYKKCHCGRNTFQYYCGDKVREIKSCGEKCGRLLNCGVHYCEMPCHPGPCEDCAELTTESCMCGQEVRFLICGKKNTYVDAKGRMFTFKNFVPSLNLSFVSCGHPCKRIRKDCGHVCNRLCHPGPCVDYPCTAKCGKKRVCGHACERTCHKGSCEDEPCTAICGADKTCCLHQCKEVCHYGKPCSEDEPCTEKIMAMCECLGQTFEMMCGATRSNPNLLPYIELVCNCKKVVENTNKLNKNKSKN